MQTVSFRNVQKKTDFRGLSPMRSPLRSQHRPLSPFRSSPFSRQQAPMSPIRARKLQRSITPKKQQRVQFTRGQNNCDQNYHSMTMTLKNGVGLFQQLANQNKIASQKKQNSKNVFYQTTPFQYSERKKENGHQGLEKNTFANLIKNVREIESFQISKAQDSSQFSSKHAENSKKSQKRQEPGMLKRKNTSTVHILESFGSPNNQNLTQNQNEAQCEIKQFVLRPQNEPSQENEAKQISSSFQQIMALIKKASGKKPSLDQQQCPQQSVKGSLEQKNVSMSFNMDPFL